MYLSNNNIFIIISFIFYLTGCSLLSSDTGKLVIINKSDYNIASCEVKVCNQIFKINNLSRDKSHLIDFKIKGDSSFEFKIIFEDQTKLEIKDGYVTTGVNYKAKALINKDSIELKDIEFN